MNIFTKLSAWSLSQRRNFFHQLNQWKSGNLGIQNCCLNPTLKIEIVMLNDAWIVGSVLKSLKFSPKDEEISRIMFNFTKRFKSVAACRLEPLQKADLVEMTQKMATTEITLAIGDGANDVPMIQVLAVKLLYQHLKTFIVVFSGSPCRNWNSGRRRTPSCAGQWLLHRPVQIPETPSVHPRSLQLPTSLQNHSLLLLQKHYSVFYQC